MTQHELLMIAAAPLIAIWCFQLDGIYIGAGLSRAMRLAKR